MQRTNQNTTTSKIMQWTGYLVPRLFKGTPNAEIKTESKQSDNALSAPIKQSMTNDELVTGYLKDYKKKKISAVLDFFIAFFKEFSTKNQDKVLCFFFKKFKKFPPGYQQNVLNFIRENSIRMDYFYISHYQKFTLNDQNKIIHHFFKKFVENNNSKTKEEVHLRKYALTFLNFNHTTLNKMEKDELFEELFKDMKRTKQKELSLATLNAAEDVYKKYDAMIEPEETAKYRVS